jgi:hypothetical protein
LELQNRRVDRLYDLNMGVYKVKLSVNSVLSELIASGSGHLVATLCPQLNIRAFAGPLTIRRMKDASLRTGDASNRSAREGSVQTILKRMSSAALTRSDLNVLTAGRSYYPTFKLSVLEAVGTQFSDPKNPHSTASVFVSAGAAAIQGDR